MSMHLVCALIQQSHWQVCAGGPQDCSVFVAMRPHMRLVLASTEKEGCYRLCHYHYLLELEALSQPPGKGGVGLGAGLMA
jgi:hypothetical protein